MRRGVPGRKFIGVGDLRGLGRHKERRAQKRVVGVLPPARQPLAQRRQNLRTGGIGSQIAGLVRIVEMVLEAFLGLLALAPTMRQHEILAEAVVAVGQ